MKRSRTEYSILNIMTGIGGYIISVFLSLMTRMVFTRCLSVDYLGINGLFANILSMLSLAELGIGGAITYSLYKPLAENDKEKIAALMKLFKDAYRIIGCVVFGLGLFVIPFLSAIIGQQPLIQENLTLIYLLYLFEVASAYFFTYRSTLLVSAQKNYLVTGINYFVLSIQEILQILFLLCTRNYIGYLLIRVAGNLIIHILISKVAEKEYPFIKEKVSNKICSEEKQIIVRNVRDLMIYKVAGVLVNGTDNIIITVFKGLSVTGLTSNYTLLVNTLNSLLNQLFGGITASIGNHNAIESEESKYSMYRFLSMLNFWLYSWGAIGIYYCSSDLVFLMFGDSYVLEPKIPLILGISFYLSGVTNVVGTYKQTMGLFRYGRFLQLYTAALNIVLSICLGKLWGVFGVLFATVISRVCTHLWYTPYVVFKKGFKKPFRLYVLEYLKYLLILGVAIALCQFTVLKINGSILTKTLLKIALCSAIVNITFIVALKESEEVARMKKYFSQVFSRIMAVKKNG